MLKNFLTAKKLFTPNSLRAYGYSGAWYDTADSRVVLASSGDVYQFDDKLGQAISLVQGTGSKQPDTGTRSINGVNILDYVSANTQKLEDTTNDLATALSGTNKPFAIYTVIQRDLTIDTQSTVVIEKNSTTVPTIVARFNASNKPTFVKRDDASNIITITGVTTIDTNPHILSYRFDGTNLKISVDGTLDSTSNLSTGLGNLTLDKIGIGARITGFDGGIGDCLILQSNPTDAIDDKIVGYLAHKYGLTANLGSGHAYKTTAPLE